jgi:hypothetical protein
VHGGLSDNVDQMVDQLSQVNVNSTNAGKSATNGGKTINGKNVSEFFVGKGSKPEDASSVSVALKKKEDTMRKW